LGGTGNEERSDGLLLSRRSGEQLVNGEDAEREERERRDLVKDKWKEAGRGIRERSRRRTELLARMEEEKRDEEDKRRRTEEMWQEEERVQEQRVRERVRRNAAAAIVIVEEETRKKKERMERIEREASVLREEEVEDGPTEEDERMKDIEEEEARIRKRKRQERREKGKPLVGSDGGRERRGRDKTEKKGDGYLSYSSSSGSERRRKRRERVAGVERKVVKEVLHPFALKSGASDKEVARFIHNASTQSRVHKWVHSEATYQGLLGTLPGDLVQILGPSATTFDGVLQSLRDYATVKEVVNESEKRVMMRRELNELRQGKNQSVGRYVAGIREVMGRFSGLKIKKEELITIFVANLIPSLHNQLKCKPFASLEEAIALAQKKEELVAKEDTSLPDTIAEGRRRGAFTVGRDAVEREDEDDDGLGVSRYGNGSMRKGSPIKALVGALGKRRVRMEEDDRERGLRIRESEMEARGRDREREMERRERAVKEEEDRYQKREEERREQQRGVNAISKDLPEVISTTKAGASLWCANCFEWCQHGTEDCVRAQGENRGGRGRGGQDWQGRGGRGGRIANAPLTCHGCHTVGHSVIFCPERVMHLMRKGILAITARQRQGDK
jgi:hypothetical protein